MNVITVNVEDIPHALVRKKKKNSMKKEDRLLNKIQKLNEVYVAWRPALKKIKKLFPKDETIKTYLWRIDKQLAKLHQYILKQLEKEAQQEQFNKIIKQLEKM